MNASWDDASAGSTAIEQLVYLSNLIGADLSLVQPGGGNTSVKLEGGDLFGCRVQCIVVKGSGTDLRTVGPGGFTHLYLERLDLLKQKDAITDEEMMSLVRACMLDPDRDPLPSVETPLHSLLPAKFVAHTHDVATLSLTDTPSAADHVHRVFGDEVTFLEYVRPGFPLAKRLTAELERGKGKGERGLAGKRALVMEKHGLAVWGETAQECWENLGSVITSAEEYVAERGTGRRAFGPAAGAGRPPLTDAARRELAATVLPAIRGELMRAGWPCVLHFDDSAETLEAIDGDHFPAVASRGVMTPEHILRAGVRPLVIKGGFELQIFVGPSSVQVPVAEHPSALRVKVAMRELQVEYKMYAKRHGHLPIPDYLKTIVIPSIGIVYAGKDRRNALIARECYNATMRVMAGAEAVERFEFLPEADACEMEYWPLERRKMEESAKTPKELEGKAALVIGAAGGIGRVTALTFVDAGAHVALADIDVNAVSALAEEINERAPERAIWMELAAADPAMVKDAVRKTVLSFGGIDALFYSPGVAPRLQSVAAMSDDEAERQMAVHYRGAVAATREVAGVMLAQGTGGRLIYNASKAAFAPGEWAAAYGASKAALVHYARNVANELGRHGITANYINADAVDTPLFRTLVQQRAEERALTEEQMLERYAERSVFGKATVPPEAVAEAALWLASDRSAHTTGCVITVGGGAEGFPR
jgi:rhamnose utilization protein RhaD (predicted bifunctional aldolase and dehydrogenase)/NAD(P)-dependent dehydrogenase (short-subunit alcohol dehydrogenase family)